MTITFWSMMLGLAVGVISAIDLWHNKRRGR